MNGSDVPTAAVAGAAAAARALLRLEEPGGDGVLAQAAGAAIALAEQFCGVQLLARGCEDQVAADGRWHRLSRTPVTAIVGVAAQAAETYAVDIDAGGDGWVRVAPGGSVRVTVSYTAGRAADWEAVSAPIALGIAMLAAHLFAHREGEAMPPAAVAALWRPFRRIRLQAERRA